MFKEYFPKNKLTSKTVKWQWKAVEQKAFDNMKAITSKETLLSYPDFNKPFNIHTDASDAQLGAVISQEGRPIAFYSRKLYAQMQYTVGERALLLIVETLKEFWNFLLGQRITVHTDHKNLTCKNYNSDRVMRWRLLIEEYGPSLEYVPGLSNIVADALSRLDLKPQATLTLKDKYKPNPAALFNQLNFSVTDLRECEYTEECLA